MSSFTIILRTKKVNYTYTLTLATKNISPGIDVLGWGTVFGTTISGGSLSLQNFETYSILGMGLVSTGTEGVYTFGINFSGVVSEAIFADISVATEGYGPFTIDNVTRAFDPDTTATQFTWPAIQVGTTWMLAETKGLNINDRTPLLLDTVTTGSAFVGNEILAVQNNYYPYYYIYDVVDEEGLGIVAGETIPQTLEFSPRTSESLIIGCTTGQGPGVLTSYTVTQKGDTWTEVDIDLTNPANTIISTSFSTNGSKLAVLSYWYNGMYDTYRVTIFDVPSVGVYNFLYTLDFDPSEVGTYGVTALDICLNSTGDKFSICYTLALVSPVGTGLRVYETSNNWSTATFTDVTCGKTGTMTNTPGVAVFSPFTGYLAVLCNQDGADCITVLSEFTNGVLYKSSGFSSPVYYNGYGSLCWHPIDGYVVANGTNGTDSTFIAMDANTGDEVVLTGLTSTGTRYAANTHQSMTYNPGASRLAVIYSDPVTPVDPSLVLYSVVGQTLDAQSLFVDFPNGKCASFGKVPTLYGGS